MAKPTPLWALVEPVKMVNHWNQLLRAPELDRCLWHHGVDGTVGTHRVEHLGEATDRLGRHPRWRCGDRCRNPPKRAAGVHRPGLRLVPQGQRPQRQP